MPSTTRAFFIGVATTFAILTAGFGGGLMLANNQMEPAPSAQTRSAAGRLPVVRVILPSSAEAARPPEAPAVTAQLEGASQPVAVAQPVAELSPVDPTKAAQQAPEKDQQADRASRRKAEAEEREHRKRVAERKARRDATRIARQMQQQEQIPQKREPGILAFDDQQTPGFGRGLLAN